MSSLVSACIAESASAVLGLSLLPNVTDGRGCPLAKTRGRRLWPVALHIPIRFHDLRHTFATGCSRVA